VIWTRYFGTGVRSFTAEIYSQPGYEFDGRKVKLLKLDLFTQPCNRQVLRSNSDWDHPERLKADVSVSVLNSLTKKIYMGKKLLRGSQAIIFGIRQLQKQVWSLSLSWSSENRHSRSSKLLGTIFFDRPLQYFAQEVGPTLTEFKHKLAYVTRRHNATPNHLVWPRELKTANQGKIILT
jgi:hypothetical protein